MEKLTFDMVKDSLLKEETIRKGNNKDISYNQNETLLWSQEEEIHKGRSQRSNDCSKL